jgi:hypothetical protein
LAVLAIIGFIVFLVRELIDVEFLTVTADEYFLSGSWRLGERMIGETRARQASDPAFVVNPRIGLW